jgi:outer membrane protein
MNRSPYRVVVALMLFCCARSAFADRRALTVEDAVELALQGNPRLGATTLRAHSAKDESLSLGARMLPSVVVQEEYQRYKDPFTLPATLFPVASGTPPILRELDTNALAVTIDQPLAGLGHLSEEYLGRRASAGAAQAAQRVARVDVATAVRQLFLQYFEAKALALVARASASELRSQVEVAQARLRAGAVTRADVLRTQVAYANVAQQELAADSQATVARAQLLSVVGLDRNDRDVELVEPLSLLAEPAPLPELAEANARAQTRRPELAQLEMTAASVRHQKNARWLSLLPEIDGEAGYVRVDGQKFIPTESYYIGVKATWPIWTWGTTFFAARAASKQAAAAALDVQSERDQIAAEVESNLAQVRAAATAIKVAREAIAAAEEAYRVEAALRDAGSATTTDLLDAQSALTTARANLARARYVHAIARLSLQRAVGD